MDTIIYLYHAKEPVRFVVEKWQENEYCLIKLGLPALLWQNLQETDGEWDTEQPASGQKLTHPEMIALLMEVCHLQTALRFLGDNPNWTFCVYEDFLKNKINTELWEQCWKVPLFEEYREFRWVQMLLVHSVYNHYIILGYVPCLLGMLCEHVKQMRTVKWYLKQEQDTQQLQDFVENFYEEYGLAIEVHLLEEDEKWSKMRPAGEQPANILDFSGEEKISAGDVAKGSVWLDMDSMEGKWKRIEARNPGVEYFSLKKLWKQRQKAPVCLDTINKNRYNT